MLKKSVAAKQTTTAKPAMKPLNREQLSEEIRKVAHELYLKKGSVPGNELGDWLEAEKIVMKNYSQQYQSK